MNILTYLISQTMNITSVFILPLKLPEEFHIWGHAYWTSDMKFKQNEGIVFFRHLSVHKHVPWNDYFRRASPYQYCIGSETVVAAIKCKHLTSILKIPFSFCIFIFLLMWGFIIMNLHLPVLTVTAKSQWYPRAHWLFVRCFIAHSLICITL